MPFDPNYPPTNAPLLSAPFRNQFNSLKSLIDAILTITAAQVDGVNTVNPGDPAGVSISVAGNTLHFTFDIPRGNDGGEGPAGPQGPPFAQAVVDGVNTTPPGSGAAVGVSFDGSAVHFTFDIPRGDKGDQGDPGEVTAQQLSDAIAGTSNNSNGVGTIDTSSFTDPDSIAVADKLNELINALRR